MAAIPSYVNLLGLSKARDHRLVLRAICICGLVGACAILAAKIAFEM